MCLLMNLVVQVFLVVPAPRQDHKSISEPASFNLRFHHVMRLISDATQKIHAYICYLFSLPLAHLLKKSYHDHSFAGKKNQNNIILIDLKKKKQLLS